MKNILKAVEIATIAHDGQYRKGTNIPYISHPISVGLLLQTGFYEEEIVIAGILHDTVEDTALTLTDIESTFGERVKRLVSDCSESNKAKEWEERKLETIRKIETIDRDSCVVICADKLHNLQSIQEDFNKFGEKVWGRFNRGKEKQSWYYKEIVDALNSRIGEERLFLQLKTLTNDVFK